MIDNFQTHIKYITRRGFKPCSNIIDNVASKEIKIYLKEDKILMQLIELHNHIVNAVDRVIHHFKNHFISVLIIGGDKFPTIIWPHLISQAQYSLNILRILLFHPKISAYHVLKVTHDFNIYPWSPPATRATIFNPPGFRTSWGARALEAWYVGPAWDHYR